jgi:uncharacterized protein YcbX
VAAHLATLAIYPIKALDGVRVERSGFAPSGALARDREWMIVDGEGQPVNGKRCVLVHGVRARYELDTLTVHLRLEGEEREGTFSLERDAAPIASWFARHLGFAVTLARDPARGFPDDAARPGPTIVSRATLERVAAWFELASWEEALARFRPNLVVDGVEAFWEDRLLAADGSAVELDVGVARLQGLNPCQRCVVPSRHPRTGAPLRKFHIEFAERRLAELPDWAPRERFEHGYKLAVNTRAPAGAATPAVRLGDAVRIARAAGAG